MALSGVLSREDAGDAWDTGAERIIRNAVNASNHVVMVRVGLCIRMVEKDVKEEEGSSKKTN